MRKIGLSVALMLAPALAACAALPEAKETGDAVILYSERLNRELTAAEKTLSESRAVRAEKAREDALAAEQNERQVAVKQREWAVAENKTAEHLFDSVRKGREQPLDFTLSISAAGSMRSDTQGGKLYDPAPLETVIKRIEDLTKSGSLRDRTESAFQFGKDIWTDMEKKQEQEDK
jgi:hypothetical protein